MRNKKGKEILVTVQIFFPRENKWFLRRTILLCNDRKREKKERKEKKKTYFSRKISIIVSCRIEGRFQRAGNVGETHERS